MLLTLPLLLDRRRACSANDHSCVPARGRGDRNRYLFIASPGAVTALSRSGPRLAVTTATSQPITRGSQIPIASARRSVVPCRPAVSSLEAYQTPALGARRTAK
jgi:hypothetical protein